jgi:acetyl esterase/lipase
MALPMIVTDAKQAIAYVRKHAAEFGIAGNKIGIIGFSAASTLAVAAAFGYTKQNRPDFVALVYAYVPAAFAMNIINDTPPLFIAAATDGEFHLVPMSISLYNKWLTAGHAAELHIYSKGGHGFFNKQK